MATPTFGISLLWTFVLACLALVLDGERHLGAARYRVADAVGEFLRKLAVAGNGEDVFAVFVFVNGEDLRDQAYADRIGLARDRIDSDLHSADSRPPLDQLLDGLCWKTGTGIDICDLTVDGSAAPARWLDPGRGPAYAPGRPGKPVLALRRWHFGKAGGHRCP